jgi:serine/threonine protein kinase
MVQSSDAFDANSTAVDNEPLGSYDQGVMGSEAVQVGSEIFGYRLTDILGRGGMGTVYKAVQLSLKREVAVKVLHSSRIKNQAQVDKFLQEARAAGRLSHPNLVAVHDAHADPERGLYCYSMEWVAGNTLGRVLQERGPLPRPTALHILFQIAKALGHAHRNGLVHRDVKPDNILVTPQGAAKLADLGLVRDRLEGVASSGSGPRRLTIVGTPEYSAPEQSRNPAKASPASDCYSLGAVLYTMLLGKPPFSGDTVIDLIVRVANLTYNLGLLFYNSLLPAVATPARSGFVSGIGVGIGYLGTILVLVALLPMQVATEHKLSLAGAVRRCSRCARPCVSCRRTGRCCCS